MKVSTRGRYALHMMLDIATHAQQSPVRIKDIAARQGMSVKYLEQIIAMLMKADYVTSVRGPQGGYRLSMAASEYTVGMILRLTEGDLSPVVCVESDSGECPKQDRCVTQRIWREMNDAISQVIDRYTLQDMIDWKNEKCPEE